MESGASSCSVSSGFYLFFEYLRLSESYLVLLYFLSHVSLMSICGSYINDTAPDVTPQNEASHLWLSCSLCFEN